MTAIELAQELNYDAQKIKYRFEKFQKQMMKKGIYVVRVDENEFGIKAKNEDEVRFQHIEGYFNRSG